MKYVEEASFEYVTLIMIIQDDSRDATEQIQEWMSSMT